MFIDLLGNLEPQVDQRLTGRDESDFGRLQGCFGLDQGPRGNRIGRRPQALDIRPPQLKLDDDVQELRLGLPDEGRIDQHQNVAGLNAFAEGLQDGCDRPGNAARQVRQRNRAPGQVGRLEDRQIRALFLAAIEHAQEPAVALGGVR